LTACVIAVEMDDPRLSVIKFDSDMGPVQFACVYLPFDQDDAEILGNFTEISAKFNAVCSKLDVVHSVIAGDFNCQACARFYNVFIQWANDLNLLLSDIKRLDSAFTSCCDDGLRSFWIDHCLCSNDVAQLITTTY
jgi:endonuclease/exonuclease/phosphatase family metal-dependent hydrolase